MRLLAKIVLLLAFATVFLAAVALLVTDARMTSTLACDKALAVCSLMQRKLTSTWNDQLPIASVDRAEVRVGHGRGASPQVWVVTSRGGYFFADYVLRPNADNVAQQINDFLKDPSPAARLELTEDARTSYWLAWALVPVILTVLVLLGLVLFRKAPPTAQT